MNYRVEKLREEIKKNELDALLVNNSFNRDYLLDIDKPFEGLCLITKNNAYFFTYSLYFQEVSKSKIKSDGWKIKLIKQKMAKELEEILKYENIRQIGIESEYLSLSKYQELKKIRKVKFIPTKNLVEVLRMIKDRNEIKNLKKACQITIECFNYIFKVLKLGISEKEVANKLDYFLRENADIGFDTIVASGIRSSFPHGISSKKKLYNGDAVVIDFGAKYNGYHADFTRTIFIGKADKEKQDVYSIVLESQQRAIDKIKEGISCAAVDTESRNFIEKKGYGKYFIHTLGHGVGRSIHEKPNLGKGNGALLTENMVVTVEPGIYIPGKFGIRIEDTVLVKKNSCEILTKFPKDIIEI